MLDAWGRGPEDKVLPLQQEFVKHGYTIISTLGYGGMSVVYEARCNTNKPVGLRKGSRVAIKVLSEILADEPNSRTRFIREADFIRNLKHPNMVELFESGEIQKRPYFVMEYLDGVDLATSLLDESDHPIQLPVPAALYIAREVCEALKLAHSKGIIHRDVKPGNIFIVGKPLEVGQVKLFDLGIATIVNEAADPKVRITRQNTTVGTPAYMAPELIAGLPNHDHHVDIYALGVTIYEMISGKLPFESNLGLELMVMHKLKVPPRLSSVAPGVPEVVDSLVMKCLEKDPKNRFNNMAELIAALESCGVEPRQPGSLDDTQVTLPTLVFQIPKRRISGKLVVAALASAIAVGSTFAIRLENRSARDAVQDGSVYSAKIETDIPGVSVMVEDTLDDGTLVQRMLGITPLETNITGAKTIFLEKDGYKRVYFSISSDNGNVSHTMEKR